MVTSRRVAVALAFVLLAGALLVCTAPARAGAAARPTAVVVVWTEDPSANLVFVHDSAKEPHDRLLRTLDAQRGMAAGLMSSIQSDYTRQQALLDISQGSRQPGSLYPGNPPELRTVPDGTGATIGGWDSARRRARDVSVTLRPGTLAGAVPGGAGFVGVHGYDDVAVGAADEHGRVAAFSTGAATTVSERVRRQLETRRLVVVALPGGDSGRAALLELVGARGPDELVVVAHLPATPSERGFGRAPTRFFRLTAFGLAGAGDATGSRDRSVRSGSTRRPGLVAAIDILPTVLDHLDVPVPDAVRGESVREVSGISPSRLEELRLRWSDVRDGRQSSSLSGVVGVSLLVLLALGTVRGMRAALRPGLRIGALAVMWWPTMVLLVAALEPGDKGTEVALIATGCVALGALTDRLLRWPRGPVVPSAVALAAYTIDLATGGTLLTRSALGPSLIAGARFYGISNELEPLLPILLLLGLAALVGMRERSRRLCLAYVLSGIALGLVVGWGRLGADVGGVLTIGGGFTVATLLMLPKGMTRRALLVAALVPFLAIAALILVDLGLSGGSHLSRNLTRSHGFTDIWELVSRRYQLAFVVLGQGRALSSVVGAGVGIAFALRNRAALYAPLRGRAWPAALVGGLACGVMGAVTNDSGPVLLTNAVIALAAITAYVQGCPELGPDAGALVERSA
jgi:hypothetical protein